MLVIFNTKLSLFLQTIHEWYALGGLIYSRDEIKWSSVSTVTSSDIVRFFFFFAYILSLMTLLIWELYDLGKSNFAMSKPVCKTTVEYI